ncbi:PIR protein [Plasmodium yoelii]|uniref:PIR protein n=2 Tax=Plasmodium yoelii TaxID=5861 RepID=A0AAE9WRY2_PLAYO|nr:PIR protein [Plasmodium yoelii]WBY55489.1 PIR protein [Plasmodium yoelii yoelii]CDS45060.1 YIR protein [Plasmodium yoelii]VTZ74012.1 PIR protein [Plasmodium yoelii]|eukprot:XP_022812314.1 PIR protein [Plasmodium yoelii]
MFNEVCKSINAIDNSFDDDPKNSEENIYESLLNFYCPDKKCNSDEEKIISGFILLLNIVNEETTDSDKLVEYAILWLSYKLNQKKQNKTTKLYDFYTEKIKKNSCYNENIADNSDSDSDSNSKINKNVICKKIKSMDIDIKDISNFYDAFKSLCNMYNEIVADDYQCNNCLENAGEFFEKCEKVKNVFDITKGSSYLQLWSSLSNDYKNFENLYNNFRCENGSSFVACPRSSIIKNILITIGIIFVAATIFLGISYKYSLFGFRKRSQKQHLREKLKK